MRRRRRFQPKWQGPEQLQIKGHRIIVKNKTCGQVRALIKHLPGFIKANRIDKGVEIIHTDNRGLIYITLSELGFI